MKNEKFQNKVKEIYANSNLDIDKLEIWNEIEKELPKPKKKSRLMILLFLGSLGFLISVYKSIQFNTDKLQTSIENQDSDTNKKRKKFALIENKLSPGSQNTAALIDQKNGGVKFIVPSVKDDLTDNSNISVDITASVPKEQKSLELRKVLQEEIAPHFNFIKRIESVSYGLNIEGAQLVEKRSEKSYLPPLDPLDFEMFNYNRELRGMNPVKFDKSDSKENVNLQLRLFMVSSFFKTSDFNSNTSDDLSVYTNLISYSNLVGLGLKHKSGFDFSLGMESRKLNQRIDWSGRVSEELVPMVSDSGSYFVYEGESHFAMGIVTDTVVVNRYLRNYNEVQSIHVPVEIGYSKEFGPLKYRVFAGASFNLINRYRGKYLGAENQIVENDQALMIYKNKFVHHLHGGVDIGKMYKNGLEIFLRGQINHSSNWNIVNDQRLIRRNYSLGLGVAYYFRN